MKYATQKKQAKRTARIVAYARKHEELSFAEIGQKFDISGAAVSLYCRTAGYRRRDAKPL
jgi:predicted ArsR family transcriptional regulator